MNNWVLIFKALASPSRLRIVKILSDKKEKNVTQIAESMNISFKAASRNLRILNSVGILNDRGWRDRVWYSLNLKMPNRQKEAVKIFLKF